MKRLITPATLIAVLVCASAALAHGSTVGVAGIQAPADATAGAPGDPCAATDPETGRVPVVMSTEAWLDYQVPGSPFFVLVDGATGRKVGQGVASHVAQLTELVRRAEHDRGHAGQHGHRLDLAGGRCDQLQSPRHPGGRLLAGTRRHHPRRLAVRPCRVLERYSLRP